MSDIKGNNKASWRFGCATSNIILNCPQLFDTRIKL